MALLQSEQGQQFVARLVQAGACSFLVLCEQEVARMHELHRLSGGNQMC